MREVGAFITGEDLQQGEPNRSLIEYFIRGLHKATLLHIVATDDLAWRMIPDVPFCSVLFRDRVGMDLHLSRATHEVQQQDDL